MSIPKSFLDEDFLLQNDVAVELYHRFAADQPILDYHCHLSPEDITANRTFKNLTQIWLEGDHYKWRAMRTNGVPEQFVTGSASDQEKFEHWAATVPSTIRNPLFHWTHLELQRYFGIKKLLSPATAAEIYENANAQLQQPELTTQGILKRMRVKVVCTTDDPADALLAHQQMAAHPFDPDIRIYPTFRPDKAILIEKEGFPGYIDLLGAVCNTTIATYEQLLSVLHDRMAFFDTLGCRAADHGLERLYAVDFTDAAADRIFQKRISGNQVTPAEAELYQSAILHALGRAYAQRGWVQQFHLGAMRNNNTRLLTRLGPDTGFDSIGDYPQAQALSGFLDRLDRDNLLAPTILYNLNPADNAVFGTIIGNFNDGSQPGKIQWGSAWWFLDQKQGMEEQLNALSNFGLLSRFVGMLTDSRSFMSMPRHEYFRRILCNLLGKDVQNGELPHDIDLLGELVSNVCYHNARQYFNF